MSKYLRLTTNSFRIDETYLKIKGIPHYLYRAIDSHGDTIDFMLFSKRNAETAKKFFSKILRCKHISKPRIINVDMDKAYPSAFRYLIEEQYLHSGCELRRIKYLNNIIEQDHRFIKKLIRAGMGFKSFLTAKNTLQGYEAMHMIRKGQIKQVLKQDIQGKIFFINSLFGITA